MREVVLDTETTGLDPETHRIVEIGCVELEGGQPSGRMFQRYVNPERDVPPESFRVHGLSEAFLADKPVFADIAEELLAFLGDATLVMHNAEFDVGFLNAEFGRLGRAAVGAERVVDTLALARVEMPKRGYHGPFGLDALCRRLAIAESDRGKHSAMEDARLLAQVYARLLGQGEQQGFGMEARVLAPGAARPAVDLPARPAALPSLLSAEEAAAHGEFVAGLGSKKVKPVWDDL